MARFHRPGQPVFPPDSNREHSLPVHLGVRVDRTPVGTTLVLFDPTLGEFLYVALTDDDVHSLADDVGSASRAISEEALDRYLADQAEDGESCTPWADEEPFPEVHDPMCGYFGYGYCQECRPPEGL